MRKYYYIEFWDKSVRKTRGALIIAKDMFKAVDLFEDNFPDMELILIKQHSVTKIIMEKEKEDE